MLTHLSVVNREQRTIHSRCGLDLLGPIPGPASMSLDPQFVTCPDCLGAGPYRCVHCNATIMLAHGADWVHEPGTQNGRFLLTCAGRTTTATPRLDVQPERI